MLGTKFFNELRTQECMGYVVLMTAGLIDNARVLYYIVQGDMNCEEIRGRIDKFIADSYKMIEDLSEDEYDDYVNSTSLSMKESGNDLLTYFFGILNQWMQTGFDLNRRERACEMIR